MSKCESQLRHFLKTLPQESAFPKQSINNFLAMTPFNATELLNIYDENWQYYLINIEQYRELVMLLYIGLTKNVNRMIESAMEFFEGMILSRFIMLIFDQKLEFQGDRVLLYLEPTVELTVLRSLESGKEHFLVSMLQRINTKKHIFNEIGFLLELVFIKKIQKVLEEPSLQEFNQLLKSFMQPKKISRIFCSQNALHFKHIVILRQQQEKQDTYFLQFMNGGKLIKLKQSFTMNVLPNWVQQAFWTLPKTLKLQQFSQMSVTSVFSLLSYVEVFASSPLVEQFTCFTTDETFLTIFEHFLMGVSISSQPYQFHWEKMKKSLQIIRKNSENQNACYKLIIAEQLLNGIKTTKTEDSISRK